MDISKLEIGFRVRLKRVDLTLLNQWVARLILVLGLMLVCGAQNGLAEETFPFLQTSTHMYSNVVVTSKTATDVFIRHSKGLATVKARDLDDAARLRLGFPPQEPPMKVAVAVPPVATPHAEAAQPKTIPWYGSTDQVKVIAIPVALILMVFPMLFFKRRPLSAHERSTEQSKAIS